MHLCRAQQDEAVELTWRPRHLCRNELSSAHHIRPVETGCTFSFLPQARGNPPHTLGSRQILCTWCVCLMTLVYTFVLSTISGWIYFKFHHHESQTIKIVCIIKIDELI
jgi:hypothetical protein